MYVLIIILAAVTVIVSVATVAGRGRAPAAPPRRLRRSARLGLLMCVAIYALMVVRDLIGKQVSSSTFVVGCSGLVMLLLWWRFGSPERFSDAEAAANYAADRQHCGQCDYDLTGNVSGICPECGWRIPQHLPAVDDRELRAMWWRPWRIEHLHNWRRTLWETVLFAAMFEGAAAFVNYVGNPLGGIVLGLLGLVFLINVGRVIAYGRRSSKR